MRRVAAPLLPAARGLVIALAAALICATLRTPLPWMIGPLVALAACRFAGVDCAGLPGGRQAGQWIIGTALGLYFTPAVAQHVGRIWWLLLLAGVFGIVLGYVCGYLLAALGGTDRTTGVFASVPGGAAEMAVLGEHFGARVDEVAAAQTLRLVLVVLIIPWIYAALKLHGADVFQPGAAEVHPGGLAALLACTALGGLALLRLGVPNAFVLGSLAVAIPLTMGEFNWSAMPRGFTNGGQLLLGCALGARFDREFLRRAPRFVGAVTASIGVAMGLSALFALIAARLTGIHPATLVLATAPGGIAEMAITAKALELGVPLVTAFHVIRVILLLTCTVPLFAWMSDRHRGSR